MDKLSSTETKMITGPGVDKVGMNVAYGVLSGENGSENSWICSEHDGFVPMAPLEAKVVVEMTTENCGKKVYDDRCKASDDPVVLDEERPDEMAVAPNGKCRSNVSDGTMCHESGVEVSCDMSYKAT